MLFLLCGRVCAASVRLMFSGVLALLRLSFSACVIFFVHKNTIVIFSVFFADFFRVHYVFED